MGEYFDISKGVKQGDQLSPVIFNVTLEQMFEKINLENKDIRFADDVVLIVENAENLIKMITDLDNKEKTAGLKINYKKSKILSNKARENKMKMLDNKIEITDEIIYLGQLFSIENKSEKEVKRTISIGWKEFWFLKTKLKGPFSLKHKNQVFNACVLSPITYGGHAQS